LNHPTEVNVIELGINEFKNSMFCFMEFQ